jgi:AraC-like DNA-binding protein
MPRTATAAASDYVRAHLDIGISLAKAASLCHLSVSEFSRVFKREHGRTFCDFLLRSRVAKAWELLASPRVTVSEVAFAVGFNDLSYFTRIFRRYTGVSASEYRKASVQRVAETGSVFRPSGSEMPTSSLHPCL